MTHLHKSLTILTASVIIAAASLVILPFDANASRGAAPLEGTWLTQVRILDCASKQVMAGPFPGLIAFHAGGTVSETGPSLPASTRGPAHGSWELAGNRTYKIRVIFQRFDLNGFFIGTQAIRADLALAKDTATYIANGTFELHDAAGTPVGSGCSRVDGTRFS